LFLNDLYDYINNGDICGATVDATCNTIILRAIYDDFIALFNKKTDYSNHVQANDDLYVLTNL